MARRSGFSLFGIPFQVRVGFMVFLVLIVLASPGPGGWWFAAAVTAFTTIHELGHAFVARSFGASPSIALDFLAGYTSYQSSRPLSPSERATIAVAGPVANIIPGVIILLVLGANPLSTDDISGSPALTAIWFAGPVLGLLNLLPVLPLDGGTIVANGIDAVAPGRGRRIMAIVSLAVTGLAAWVVLQNQQWRPFLPVMVFLGLMQLQELGGSRQLRRAPDPRLLDEAADLAERSAWSTGTVPLFPPPYEISPWYRARQFLERQSPDRAVATLLDAAQADEPRYRLPSSAPPHQIGELADLLPTDLPARGSWGELYLIRSMQLGGRARRAGEYAAAIYGHTRDPRFAAEVAAAAATLGEIPTAMSWLRTAAPGMHRAHIERDPRLDVLRDDPEFADIRRLAHQ